MTSYKKDSLGTRMKEYESVLANKLIRRTPVIIRLDGKAFHTFTRGMNKPFDEELMLCMSLATQYLVKNIEGCEFGYTQSDEISLLLTDYKRLETQAWFDYKVQKMVSIASSMCTLAFNENFQGHFAKAGRKDFLDRSAFFDARAFNIPRDEVVNYFHWRQSDWTRNSIQMVGRSKFSQKQLHGKSCNEIQELLFTEKGINWNDIETYKKRGNCVYKRGVVTEMVQKSIDVVDYNVMSVGYNGVIRNEYYIDYEIPIFTQDREFIQKWVDVDQRR
jgi:tRNA(His) 5'-end guanylyltransferase